MSTNYWINSRRQWTSATTRRETSVRFCLEAIRHPEDYVAFLNALDVAPTSSGVMLLPAPPSNSRWGWHNMSVPDPDGSIGLPGEPSPAVISETGDPAASCEERRGLSVSDSEETALKGRSPYESSNDSVARARCGHLLPDEKPTHVNSLTD